MVLSRRANERSVTGLFDAARKKILQLRSFFAGFKNRLLRRARMVHSQFKEFR